MKDPNRTVAVTILADAPSGGYAFPGSLLPIIDGETKKVVSIGLACPGCGWWSGMMVGDPKPVPQPSWLFTGDVFKPETLNMSPSINCVGCCGWHGHLKDGMFSTK